MELSETNTSKLCKVEDKVESDDNGFERTSSMKCKDELKNG
jgi:hypothetical protein